MNKKKVLLLLTTTSLCITAGLVFVTNGGLNNVEAFGLHRNGGLSDYALEFSSSKNKLFNETDSARHAGVTACKTNLDNDVYIAYADSFYSAGNFISLGTSYGAFCNYSPDPEASEYAYPELSPIHGMTSISFTFPDNISQKNFKITYGNTLMNRLYDKGENWDENVGPRYWFNQPAAGLYTGYEQVNITDNTYTFDFNDASPSHFYVENWGDDNLVISSVRIEYSCSSSSYSYNFYAYSEDNNLGTVSYSSNSYQVGTSVTVTANPATDYTLLGWYHNGELVSKDNPYTFTMPSNNYILSARFIEFQILWDAEHGVTPIYDEETNKVTYGLMPQSKVTDSDLITTLNSLDDSYKGINNWYLYNHEYYVKKGSNWYICERLSWLVLSKNTSTGEYLLLSEKLLGRNSFGESTDYSVSNVRNWLIGDFYSSVFALDNDNLLNVYGEDKVTILEYNDFKNPAYGFSGGTGSDAKRRASYTDYSYGEVTNAFYWTRTVSSQNVSMLLCYVEYTSGSMSVNAYKKDTYAIRPTIKIQIS